MKNSPRFNTSKVGLGVAQALSLSLTLFIPTANAADADADAAQTDAQQIEVISVVGRLQRVASEVIDERREQPYVADLMGAEQIGRSGDSDAAAALRRITGLTLRDGKFIYVRGLGERYSSTSLNGASVPSPDPTRSVLPLDMFPASIIESLSVQKGASPAAPAAFGGGHVDIRTKSIPNDFFIKASLGSQYNSNHSNDRLTYANADDALGQDNGLRQLPDAINQAMAQYGGVSVTDIYRSVGDIDQAEAINRNLALTMNRDMTVTKDDADLGYRGSASIGNRFELDNNGDWRFGFVAGSYYKKQVENYQKQAFELANANGEIATSSLVSGSDSIVQWSLMGNMGLEFTDDHKIETFTTYLHDSSDDVSVAINETIDTIDEDNALQQYDINYQQRLLVANQIRGEHFFPQLWDLQANWFYTDARAERDAPTELSYKYSVLQDANGDISSRALQGRADAAVYRYSLLQDDSKNYGYQLTLPLLLGDAELELTGGYQSFERSRTAYSTRLAFDTSDYQTELLTGEFDQIFSDGAINDPANGFALLDTTSETDDYVAAQRLDAGFAEFDLTWADDFRVTAGVRYEDHKQMVLPLTADGEISDEGGRNQLSDYTRAEDGWFPSLSATWIQNEQMQWRFALSKTIVRPDLREVAPVRFQDPDSGFDMIGYSELRSSDIINLDLRWEWYLESGSNLSVAGFYKELDAPIESVQVITEQDTLLTFQNADRGELYGIETEFHQELGFISPNSDVWDGLFFAGNLTLSDSQIEISPAGNINPTNLTRRMTGHSEWVANMQLSFDSMDQSHAATLVYNVFGDRIAYAGTAGLDDVYEQPFSSLDFTYAYYPMPQLAIKVKAKNLLAQKSEYQQEGQRVFYKQPGSEYTLTFGFDF
ncbi:TonB-dependent receptor [uncultured Ferrimonas sp.]|uniref:TonB-dependent receptor domain-containing protein n=1 Tax=uncultured Ferrimonas sp. TaxID=432640 RepID=UPI00261599DC|nr:TonB-dependent receptor [uncultured Ferrimonas sp.]